MANTPRTPVFFLLLTALFQAQSSRAQLPPTDNQESSLPRDKTPAQTLGLVALNFGIREFKQGDRERAIGYFTEAKRLDPNLLSAQLYLGTAYASSYLLGDTSAVNRMNGEAALAEFRNVLAHDSQNISALDGLGAIRFQMAGSPFDRETFLESKAYFQKHLQVKSTDVEPYYWIGVIDWTLASHANRELRTRLNQQQVGPLPPEIREQYSGENGTIIDDGIEALKQALSLRPDYDDAMAYLNLLYRRKADVVESPTERDELIKQADDLIDKVKEIKANRVKARLSPNAKPE
jgi:tetratricopeptide (TPR) repeat protein